MNQQFEVLENLLQEYLEVTKNRGGTLGFCIGAHLERIRASRKGINTMCGKLPPYDAPDNITAETLKWARYGQWRHPGPWWENSLKRYLALLNGEGLEPKPIIMELTAKEITYRMKQDGEARTISKEAILTVLYPGLHII